jgi:glycosyltransferase involved in cell wall biosynthesis
MPLPAFSVVTISFNQAPFLDECMRSVIEQDYPFLEYIVVDPGSQDHSRQIIQSHRSVLSSVVLEPDDGPADGLNKGFAKARGQIYCYLNADDRLMPGALRFAGEFFDAHPDVDVLCGAIRIIDRDGRPATRNRTADPFDLVRYAAGVCTVGQQATFFRRRAYEKARGFNAANRISWDGELLVDMALAGAKFKTVPKLLGDFRIYGESITGSNKFRQKQIDEHARIAEKIAGRGVRLYTPLQTRLQQLAYRFNPFRHLHYMMVR